MIKKVSHACSKLNNRWPNPMKIHGKILKMLQYFCWSIEVIGIFARLWNFNHFPKYKKKFNTFPSIIMKQRTIYENIHFLPTLKIATFSLLSLNLMTLQTWFFGIYWKIYISHKSDTNFINIPPVCECSVRQRSWRHFHEPLGIFKILLHWWTLN